MSNYVAHKKGMNLTEFDNEVLKILYKVEFANVKHIALITGENIDYCTGRLKKLAREKYIVRLSLKSNELAINYITKKGISTAGLPPRNVRPPTLGRYEHSLGCSDMYVYFCLLRKFKDSRFARFVHFGNIITERDFNAVRELKEVGKKKNGQPILKSLDFDIHHPDGYFCKNGKYYALEFERTAKSTYEIVRDNALDNCKRFAKQFWVYDKKSVYNYLLKVQAEIGADRIQLIDIRKVREQLQKAVVNLPAVISKKSGKPRQSAFGKMVEPTPLNRLPLLPSAVKKAVLESRTKTATSISDKPSATVQKSTVRTNKPLAPIKPKLKLEKRRK